jgi:thioesterase domain-containing protein
MPYRALARRFADGRAVVGLQSPALTGGAAADSVKELAALQVTALRARQPQGPYCLCGWSFGGLLAYEVAQQLTQAGERVEVLALIDSYTPAAAKSLERRIGDGDVTDPEAKLVLGFASDILGGYHDVLAELEHAAARDEPAEALLARLAGGLGGTEAEAAGDADRLGGLFSLFKAHVAAMSTYVPKPYAGGPVVLVSADHAFGKGLESPPDHGWSSLVAADRMTRRAITTANHYTILEEPNVAELAAILRRVLEDESRASLAGQ